MILRIVKKYCLLSLKSRLKTLVTLLSLLTVFAQRQTQIRCQLNKYPSTCFQKAFAISGVDDTIAHINYLQFFTKSETFF